MEGGGGGGGGGNAAREPGRKLYVTPIRFKLPYTLLLGLHSKHKTLYTFTQTEKKSNDSNTRAPISTAKTDVLFSAK